MLNYPDSKRSDHVDNLHGLEIPDPYRWLEDIDSKETLDWINSQNECTFNYLKKIPAREKIANRLTELWDYDKLSAPSLKGGKYFFYRHDGLQNQAVLYWKESLGGEANLLIDPNTLSEDGTIAMNDATVSPDGKLLAYSLAVAGSDWKDFHIKEVECGKDLSDHVKWAKFTGAAWTKDSSGFFYSRYDEPTEGTKLKKANYYQKLYYHKVGDDQTKDVLVYEDKENKEWGFAGEVSDDGKFLLIVVWQGTKSENCIFYKSLEDDNAEVVELLTEFDASYGFIGNDDNIFYFQTDLNAACSKIIAIDINNPERDNWRDIVAESTDNLESSQLMQDKIILTYLHDASSRVVVFDLKNNSFENFELPGIGTVGGFGGRRENTERFYSYMSFTSPTVTYRYDFETGEGTVYHRSEVDFNPDNFTIKQIFYTSKDGTKIPLFICHKKGLELTADNPTYLYGYGGFNIPLTPAFSLINSVWMEMGGVLAIANLRGGGEYGSAWHKAGSRHNRQNVFDDFIAGAEWLIENKYTSTNKLAIGGGSNGGLLVGACMTQRPDLFAACLPSVGVLDMLRFHKFTIGWAWASDYGSPDDPDDFKYIYKYSPLHNLKDGVNYPATLVRTGDHDDRVFPAHSFKYAAELQHVQSGGNPVMIRVETRAGHGMGKPTAKIIEEAADGWAFLVKNLGMEV
ncbi:MAG: S9 family peptidase [Calditrichaeota bacterium]|nr:S9 family peptidase [Calditrichota bacterium]MBT7788959.1 S9 family peptidase [Calditrichota bacterium]